MNKKLNRWLVLAATLGMMQISLAQVPAGAPAGATALCNDGTYYTGANKRGACSGHQGVKQWYGTASASGTTSGSSASGTAAPSGAAAPAAPAPTARPSSPQSAQEAVQPRAGAGATARTQAAGGGPGMVWVNTSSNVYHCPGSRYYGTTKAGAYMSETEAKARGARPDHGKPCQ